MGVLLRRKKKTPIGIDIGSGGARAVQLVRDDNGYQTLHLARTDRSGPDPEGEDRVLRTRRQISACMQHTTFSGRAAVMALNAPDVEFHALDLPRASRSELEQIVRLEVERLMTIAEGATEVRYWTVPEGNAAAPNAIGVVASTEMILDCVKACRQTKMMCAAVHPAAIALCQLGCLLKKQPADVIWGLLDLGLTLSRLVVCVDDRPVLVRSVGRGGDSWSKRIAEALQTSVKTAEVQKRDHGIAPPAGPSATGTGPTDLGMPSMILGKLRSDLNDLASEVKRSYEYVLSCYPNRHAGSLILVGGGAAMRHLPEFLADSLGIPVERASHHLSGPTCRLAQAPAGPNSLEQCALAIGLAAVGAKGVPWEIPQGNS